MKQETLIQIDQNNPVTRGSTALVYKQETLVEAGLKHCNMLDEFPALVNPLFSFKQGAKWQQENSNINALHFEIDALKREVKLLKYQQERSYSEEEVENLLKLILNKQYDCGEMFDVVSSYDIKELFEQLKNK